MACSAKPLGCCRRQVARSSTPLRCCRRKVYNNVNADGSPAAEPAPSADLSSEKAHHEEVELLRCDTTPHFNLRTVMIAAFASAALTFFAVVGVLAAPRPRLRHGTLSSRHSETGNKSLAFPDKADVAPSFLLVSQDSNKHASGPLHGSDIGTEADTSASTYDGVPWWANQSEANAILDDTSDASFEEDADEHQPLPRRPRQGLEPRSKPVGEVLPCGTLQDQSDYPGNDLGAPFLISSSEECCQKCALNLNCVAWTVMKLKQLCFLKGGHPKGVLTAVFNAETISGMPTQVGRSIPTVTRKAGQSIFCFSLMLPWGNEKRLLQMQYRNGASIFSCDEYAVYSNKEIQVAEGVITRRVDSKLECDHPQVGDEFKTCLNTQVFMKVWDRILKDNRPRLHDWTVKVDPDAVFFPARLRSVLLSHQETPRGIYLNNCPLGLHGPLEVFSRNAVSAWSYGRNACVKHFRMVCSGDCQWGEDMFIDQCLWKVLKVKRAFEPALLVENHCKQQPAAWQDCQDTGKVCFHPFKDRGEYWECMKNAEVSLNRTYK